MKSKWLLLGLITMANHAFAVFPTNSCIVTVDVAKVTGQYNSFRFDWMGYESRSIKFFLNENGTYLNLTGYYAAFKVARKSSSGGQTAYISKTSGDMTVSGSNVSCTVAYTNIPANGRYLAELWMWEGTTTNTTRVMAQGYIDTANSLYATDDSTFPWPTNQDILVNYVKTSDAAYIAAVTNGSLSAGGSFSRSVASRIITDTYPSTVVTTATKTAGADYNLAVSGSGVTLTYPTTSVTTATETAGAVFDLAVSGRSVTLTYPTTHATQEWVTATFAPLTRTLTAGDGLSGGGTLAADRSFAVDGSVVRTNTGAYSAGITNVTGDTEAVVAGSGRTRELSIGGTIARDSEWQAGDLLQPFLASNGTYGADTTQNMPWVRFGGLVGALTGEDVNTSPVIYSPLNNIQHFPAFGATISFFPVSLQQYLNNALSENDACLYIDTTHPDTVQIRTNLYVTGAIYSGGGWGIGTNLASLYLGLSAKAADSELLDNYDSTFFVGTNNAIWLAALTNLSTTSGGAWSATGSSRIGAITYPANIATNGMTGDTEFVLTGPANCQTGSIGSAIARDSEVQASTSGVATTILGLKIGSATNADYATVSATSTNSLQLGGIAAANYASNSLFAGSGTTGQVTSSGGDAGKYLLADGTWATPAGGSGGSSGRMSWIKTSDWCGDQPGSGSLGTGTNNVVYTGYSTPNATNNGAAGDAWYSSQTVLNDKYYYAFLPAPATNSVLNTLTIWVRSGNVSTLTNSCTILVDDTINTYTTNNLCSSTAAQWLGYAVPAASVNVAWTNSTPYSVEGGQTNWGFNVRCDAFTSYSNSIQCKVRALWN